MENFKSEVCVLLLHVGTGPPATQDSGSSRLVVRDDDPRFELEKHIWIERLEEDFAKKVQIACEPCHFNMPSVNFDRHLYAFVKRQTESESPDAATTQLRATVVLSRLIRPTSAGDRYCAIVHRFAPSQYTIKAIQFRGVSPDVILNAGHRDWLSVEDAEELKRLMPWTVRDKLMLPRVHRAYWYHEYAMRSYYLDARWTLVVTGLEALVNVGTEGDNAWQFKNRVGQIAAKLGLSASGDELRKAYKLRSKVAHGESFLSGLESVLPPDEHSDLYERLECLLRAAIKRCLLDEDFGRTFEDDKAVMTNWPIPPRPPRT